MTNDNHTSQTELCIKAFDAALTDLRAQGVETVFMIPALGEICAKIVKHEPDGAILLDSLVAILDALAQAMRARTAMNMAQAIFWRPQSHCPPAHARRNQGAGSYSRVGE